MASSSETRLQEVSIFSELSKKEIKAVARLMTEVSIDEGKVLTEQGTRGREFMVIVDGSAEVDIDGTVVAQLGPGDFLGELAIISGAPRSATVRTTSTTLIETLNRREFMALLDESPTLSKKILVGAVKRLQANEANKAN